jgi:hypothetical protein
MRQALCFGAILMALLSFGQAAAEQIERPLRVHPDNPRYFTDGSKNADGSLKAVYLTGSHTWNNLQDGCFFTAEAADPPPAFDFGHYLDFLQRHNHNFIRLWRFENPKFFYWLDTDNSAQRTPSSRMGWQFSQPHPWVRTGPGIAADGKPKFDLKQFDPAYFDRLRSRVIAAGDRGLYVSVMLFEGGMTRGKAPHHPFHRANNINGIESDANGDGCGVEVHSLLVAAITELQKSYIRHLVDTVNDLDNVLYEVGNEFAYSADNTQWQNWVAKFIKEYQATKPKQHPVGITAPMHHPWKTSIPNDPRNATLFEGPADWVSPANGGGSGYPDDRALGGSGSTIPVADGSKVILLDTDHVFGAAGGNRNWVWRAFTRGHNPIFMDHLPEITEHVGRYPEASEIREAMGHTRAYANQMNLAAMTPRGDLASTQYCLANPGQEYLVYLPEGGEVIVDLSHGKESFAVEWFNPSTNTATDGGTVHGGGKRTLQSPFEGQAVLYVRK